MSNAEKIIEIASDMYDKYKFNTGEDLAKPIYKEEFLKRFKEQNLSFNDDTYAYLEGCNYHTANKILKEEMKK